MQTQNFTDTLIVETCCQAACGVTFGIQRDHQRRLRQTHDTFYCPNGHGQHYTGQTDAEREKSRREAAERQTRYARAARDAALDQAEAAERTARAYKGHVTRLRNRIANGVCPVPGCRRSFVNVRAHITGQHADWAHEHEEALQP
jgi:hypothetical protein